MKLCDFLRHETNVHELCAICEDGYEVATCWIDHEDLFIIPPRLANREIQRNYWDVLPIVTENNNKIYVPCHYIDV